MRAVIGGFRSDLSITRKTDRNFGNVSSGALFSKVAYINENGGNRTSVVRFIVMQPVLFLIKLRSPKETKINSAAL